jgi:hypothetical protein
MDWIGKWKAIIMGRDGPRGYCGKMVLNCKVFIIGYPQFVKRENTCRQHCVQMGTELQHWLGKYIDCCP